MNPDQRVVVGYLRERTATAQARRRAASRRVSVPVEEVMGGFDHVLGPGVKVEDQAGLVVHHDLTPEAQAQLDRAEKVARELKEALFIIAGAIVVIALVGGVAYYAGSRKKKKKKKKKGLILRAPE